MFRDEYTNFSFNELESENFKVWITNKNDLKRNMSPNFSDKFNTPTGSQIRYHEGTTIDKQDFKLSCAAIDVTLNEWRAITEWLSPLKQGKLRFEWNDNYYYMVKISKAPSGTMFIKGRIDSIMGQLYIITFDLEFTTVHDWAALGNYAEQNSIKEIDISVYNNEYYMPSIIMRDKYIYRTALKDQTLYPSGDVVIVSSGNANDFALLDSDTDGIESLVYNKIPLPTTVTFKHGLAPVIAFWDYNQGSYSQPMTICSDTLETMEDIVAEVRTKDFVIRYSASYDIDKNVVLTLYTEGIIDDYENKFVLINVIDNTHPDYKYPKTDIIIDKIPVIIYVGETYTIKAQAYNTLKNVNWSGTTGINIYPQEDGCKFSIPADWDTNQVINIVATVVETYDETVTEAIFGEIGMYAQKPALIISSDKLNLGVDETAQLHAEFYGLNDTYFEWIIDEDSLESIAISDWDGSKATITGLKPDAEVVLQARGRTNLSDVNDVVSNSITIAIKNSTVELRPDASSTTPLRLGQDYKLIIDVIGETDKGFLDWKCETNPSIREKLEFEVIPAADTGDRYWTIKSPYTLTDIDGNELMNTTCTATAIRMFTDGRDEDTFSSSLEFTWFKGIEIQNINSFYSTSRTESGDFNIVNVQLTDCIKYNYFSDTSKYDTVEWSSNKPNVIEIHKLPDESDGNIQMTFNSYGEATITCTLKKEGVEVDSASINVEVIEQNVFKWNDKNIIQYQREDGLKDEIPNTIFDFELDGIISNIVQKYSSCVIRVIQRKDGWYELAYFPESYDEKGLQVYVDLEGCGFEQCEDQTNINSIKELLTFDNSYDAVMRVNNKGEVTYYTPVSAWRNTTTTEINLKTFLDYYINKVTIEDDYGYLDWTTSELEGLSLDSIDFEFAENDDRTIRIYYPSQAESCYGYLKKGDKYQIAQFSSSNGNYCDITLSEDFGNEGTVVAYYNQPYSTNAYFRLVSGSFIDRLFNIQLNAHFFGTLQSETSSIVITNGEISWYDGSNIHVYHTPSVIEDDKNNENDDMDRINAVNITLESSHHAIDSIYEIATPTKFTLRRKPKSLDFPNGGTPQLGVLSMENNIIGYVYNTPDKTYYRHYLADGTNYWDELIGTPSYYQFQSHPTYSLLNHNFQDSSDTQFNSALTLTLKANNNTVICNTGVFNMYPLFFVKGGCHIKDSLYEYYSFLTNTNMKNLFVTINSRTSTMLHNGYAIDGSYNSLGRPLFKDIKNENQLLISSGRPELLKAVLISDEEIEYSDQQTGRRIAKFLINSKPMYGLRNKFAMHIFNESFKDVTNIYNKTGYNALSYYNTMNNIKHILIDSPSVTFEQEPGGWTMSVSYRSSDKGLSSTKFHDFIRHSKRVEETQYDEYSNVGSVAEIAPKNSFVYISVCDYKELDILSEGEDYSVGCQARGVI